MIPLGVVLFGAGLGGGFAVGALLVGAHAAGDVLAAPWIGRRLSMRAGLLGEAASLAVLVTVGIVGGVPIAVLAAVAALAGAISAGVPGEQRARLAALTAPEVHPAAFSLESTASALLYAVGPALVGLLAAAGPALAMSVAAAIAALGGLLAHTPPRSANSGRADDEALGAAAVFRLAWPSYLGAAGFMLAITVLDIVIPARLADLGADPRLAGALLGALALTGTVGGLVYGSRRWPSSPSRHALVLILLLCGTLATVPLLAHPATMAGLLLLAGLLGPPALVARSLVLQARLPTASMATGFSGLSAAAGVGASTAGLLAAPLLSVTSPNTTLLTALALTTAAAAISAAGERPRP